MGGDVTPDRFGTSTPMPTHVFFTLLGSVFIAAGATVWLISEMPGLASILLPLTLALTAGVWTVRRKR